MSALIETGIICHSSVSKTFGLTLKIRLVILSDAPKALSPKYSTLSGIVIEVSPVQPSKLLSLMKIILSGMVIEESPVQPLKAP